MSSRPGVLALVAVLSLAPANALACPFCTVQGQTFAGEVAQADFILYGTLSNAKQTDAFSGGTTDLTIEQVVKPHDYLKGKTVVTLPKYVPANPANGGAKHLVFFYYNPASGALDPYRGEEVRADSKLPEYIKGSLAVKGKDPLARLKYFFDYLESPELTISSDAYVEFGLAEYKEVRPIAEALPADLLVKWLKDPNTRASRYGLYGLMLGHCGKGANAADLRKLLDDPDRAFSSGLDGMLAGYVLLDPKAGWEYLTGYVRDPKKDFSARYAALKTVRFFWEYRPDVVDRKHVVDAMRMLLSQPDIADLPVEDLRKWRAWDLTDEVLALGDKETHNTIPIVNRSILKFALSAAPGSANAAAYVQKARQKDARKVEFMEELLKDEQKPPAPSTSDPAKSAAAPSAGK